MDNAKTRSPFKLGHPLNLGDPQVIGIVIAIFTVLITIGFFLWRYKGCKEGSLADGVERCRENSDLYSIIALQVC